MKRGGGIVTTPQSLTRKKVAEFSLIHLLRGASPYYVTINYLTLIVTVTVLTAALYSALPAAVT